MQGRYGGLYIAIIIGCYGRPYILVGITVNVYGGSCMDG